MRPKAGAVKSPNGDTDGRRKHSVWSGGWRGDDHAEPPDRLNNFNPDMHLALREALASAAKEARAVLLTGAGRGFCAGQDLSDRSVAADEAPPDIGASIDLYYKPLILQIKRLPMPVVCAVNGVAAGAGVSVALACDMVFAAKSASFIQAFSKIGLIPDSGGTWFLPA